VCLKSALNAHKARSVYRGMKVEHSEECSGGQRNGRLLTKHVKGKENESLGEAAKTHFKAREHWIGELKAV